MKIYNYVLLSLFCCSMLGCATLHPDAPTTRIKIDGDKEVVFQAALGTLQEMGMDMRTADAQNGTLKTKWIDSPVDAHTSLHYQLLISITQPAGGKSELDIRVQGEKIHKLAGMSYSSTLDESDPDMKPKIESILSATGGKIRGPLP